MLDAIALYALAILGPPFAVAWCRRPWHFIVNLLLTVSLVLWPAAVIHAIWLIHGYRSSIEYRAGKVGRANPMESFGGRV